ncbi:MAG: hypothetical protein K2X07_02835 [Caulobacteraceae bacterium]|nr:hypothetical protein [Caulobacteraceae bacterium]
MALPPRDEGPPEMESPGALAGAAGAGCSSNGGSEQGEAYTVLRTVFNDDGHFLGLEVAHG